MRFRHLSAVILMTFTVALSYAQTSIQSEALGFSRILQDPVATGLGFAGRASTHNPAWSSWTNAAAIPFYDGKADFGVSYQHWAPSSAIERTIAAGAAGHFGVFGASLGFMTRSGEPYDIIDLNGVPDGQFKPRDIVGSAGLSIRLVKWLSLGVDLRYIHQSYYPQASLSSFAADALLMARFGDFRVTAGIANVGGQVKDAEGEYWSLPTSIAFGAGYEAVFGGKHGVNAYIDFDYFYAVKAVTFAVGAEYSFNDIVFVRGGYHFGSVGAALPQFASVGLGAKYWGVKINASYTFANKDLMNTFTVGLGYCF
ncbi:MAG: PorV/PorQ family protein [Bacteroidales bacterium]|nr:PorV/PorQ family protein [Bacteroidales bacterium]